eukprot:Rmarinus@m.29543
MRTICSCIILKKCLSWTLGENGSTCPRPLLKRRARIAMYARKITGLRAVHTTQPQKVPILQMLEMRVLQAANLAPHTAQAVEATAVVVVVVMVVMVMVVVVVMVMVVMVVMVVV